MAGLGFSLGLYCPCFLLLVFIFCSPLSCKAQPVAFCLVSFPVGIRVVECLFELRAVRRFLSLIGYSQRINEECSVQLVFAARINSYCTHILVLQHSPCHYILVFVGYLCWKQRSSRYIYISWYRRARFQQNASTEEYRSNPGIK